MADAIIARTGAPPFLLSKVVPAVLVNVTGEIAEARAHALGLREAARACGPAQPALKVRLAAAAESLQTLSLLTARALNRIEELQQQVAKATASQPATPGQVAES